MTQPEQPQPTGDERPSGARRLVERLYPYRFFIAGACVAVAIAVGVGVYFAAFAGGGGGTAPPVVVEPSPMQCARASVIHPEETSGPADWEKVTLPASADCFDLTATNSDATGVGTDSSFVLESKDRLDVSTLAARLTVKPKLDFSVTPDKSSATRYEIDFKSALAEDTVYRFTLLDAPGGATVGAWAFQTQRPLRVVQSLPADNSTGVPLNIGIELTFSEDNLTGLQDNFKIEPDTKGRFEVHKRTLAFVPESLSPLTLYTVTMGANAGVTGSDRTLGTPFVFQFETGTADATVAPQPPLQFSRRVWESATTEAPALALFAYSPSGPGKLTGPLPVAVYRYPDIDTFLTALDKFTSLPNWASQTRSRFLADRSGLGDPVASFEATLQSLTDYGDSYIRFPEALASGYYLVEATREGTKVQAWLQVTDIAAYAAVSRGRTLVWMNDIATGAPLSGATVRGVGLDLSATTGTDGAAFFDTPPDMIHLETSPFGYTTRDAVANLIVTAPDGRTAVVPLADIFGGYRYYGFREYSYAGDPNTYWRFLYADRHLYRPTDTVNIFGLVRDREKPTAAQDVVLELNGTNYVEKGGYTTVNVARTTVATAADGTFIGALPISGVSPGFYNVQARIGDQIFASAYVQVADFVTPAYKIEVTPARKAVFSGEQLDYRIQASYFDGTPVPNVQLSYSTGYKTDSAGTVTTDASGRASVSYTASFSAVSGYGDYGYDTLNVAPTTAEEGEITGSASVQVFASGLSISATAQFGDSSVAVSGTVVNVNLDQVNSEQSLDAKPSFTGGQFGLNYAGPPAPGRQVVASVDETSYKRVEIGDTYDFITKTVTKQYRYDPVQTSIGQFSAVTDGQGQFTITFPGARDKSYVATLTVKDDDGRVSTTQVYAYSGNDVYNRGAVLNAEPNRPVAIGEQVNLHMSVGGASDTPLTGRFLFYLAQGGIRRYAVQDTPDYSFTFADEDVPNVDGVAVRFTGATYQEVLYPVTVSFDSSSRALHISVTPGQPGYHPGDVATLAVTVTDQQGQPVQAKVLLSAIDDAVYKLEGQSFYYDLDILQSLYDMVSPGVLRTYASHQYPNAAATGERGGDGGGGRQNFADIAFFNTVTTDAQGHGSVSFKLPDNLTSWRVTALGVTNDLRAGASVSLVPVSLPLFVDSSLNTSYLTTDKPQLRVRAFGNALSPGQAVSFQVSSPTLLATPVTVPGVAFDPVEIALPPLKEGRHELTIRVSSGGLEDAVVRKITVTPSRVLQSQAHFYELSAGGSVSLEGGATGATTVVFSDHNRGRYFPDLLSLSYTYGDRVDQMLARSLSQQLLSTYFQQEADLPAEFQASRYQTPDGGIAIYPFADDDLTLSARVASLAPGQFGREAFAAYFQKVIDNPDETRERAIIAYYGLGALGEPVLSAVQQLATIGDLSARERLYLGLAAAALGDTNTAQALYRGLLEQYGQRRGGAVRLRVGEDQDDILEATSLAAILGASLGDDFAPLLYEYARTNYTKDILVSLEQISYLAQALPNLAATPVRFAYAAGGQRQEATLDQGESLGLLLSPGDLKALNLQVTDGTLGVSVSFLAPVDPASLKVDPQVTISRAYGGQTPAGVTVHEGDLVRITLNATLSDQAVDGCYQVSDYLPSGLRPVTRLYAWPAADKSQSNTAYPYSIEGQRVSFCLYKGSVRPLVYYARVIGKGSFTAEPALIQSQKAAESVNHSEAVAVQVQ